MRKMGGPDKPGHDGLVGSQPQGKLPCPHPSARVPDPCRVRASLRLLLPRRSKLRNRLWRRRDKPLSIAKKRERQTHCSGSLANVRFPSERGTVKREEN